MNIPAPIGLALVVCEAVHRDDAGKVSLHGIMNRIEADSFPWTLPSLAVYLAMTDIHAATRCRIELIDGQTEETLFTFPEIELPPMLALVGNSVLDCDLMLTPFPVEFPRPGAYLIRLFANDALLLQRPVQVEDIRQKVEMNLLESAKETENKLRWDGKVGKTKFSLYVPKWRIPTPPPRHVRVYVEPAPTEDAQLPRLTRDDVEDDDALRTRPIAVVVKKVQEHTETVRYSPTGDSKDWEIGEPYIPHPLTFASAERLLVRVEWDLKSRGNF